MYIVTQSHITTLIHCHSSISDDVDGRVRRSASASNSGAAQEGLSTPSFELVPAFTKVRTKALSPGWLTSVLLSSTTVVRMRWRQCRSTSPLWHTHAWLPPVDNRFPITSTDATAHKAVSQSRQSSPTRSPHVNGNGHQHLQDDLTQSLLTSHFAHATGRHKGAGYTSITDCEDEQELDAVEVSAMAREDRLLHTMRKQEEKWAKGKKDDRELVQ